MDLVHLLFLELDLLVVCYLLLLSLLFQRHLLNLLHFHLFQEIFLHLHHLQML